MVQVGVGDEKVTLPRRAETSPGKWEDVGSDEVEAREVWWRRLQAGQTDIQGGQFTAEGGQRFSVPFGDYGFVWMEHDYPAPVTLRYLIAPESEEPSQPGAVYLWNPGEGGGLMVSGTQAEFKRAKTREVSNKNLKMGWEFPKRAEEVANTPSGSGGLEVTFNPGPGSGNPVFAAEVYDHLRGKGEI